MAVAAIAGAAAGLLLGGFLGDGGNAPAPRPATPAQSITHDGVRLQVPSGWARTDVTAVPGFSRPLALRNSDDGLRATVERLPATSATLLPAAYVKTLSSVPEPPDVVRLSGGRQAWRYRFPATDGSMTLLYAAPTTVGVATVACTSPLEDRVPRACDALASAVTVPDSRPLRPSRNAAFFSRLPAAVHDLNASRPSGLEGLAAASRPKRQALAADQLARAHRAAGAALAPVSDGRGLSGATTGALTATARAYAALASAARARSPRPYADASRAVSGAETDLRRAMAKAAAATSLASSTVTRAPAAPVSTPAAPVSTPAATTKQAPKAAAKPKQAPKAAAKPKTRTKPASTKAAAKASPAAGAAGGMSFTPIILGLLVLMTVFGVLAERATRP